MKLFSGAIVAKKPVKELGISLEFVGIFNTFVGIVIVPAVDLEQAQKKALDHATQTFPEREGYTQHQVILQEVTPELMKKVLGPFVVFLEAP